MKYGTGPQRTEHSPYLLIVFLFYQSAFEFFLSEGLDFMKPRQIILQFGIQFAHTSLGCLKERPHLFCEYYAGKQDQRNGTAGNQCQPPVNDQQNKEHPCKGYQIRYHFRNHVGIKQLKIPGIVHHPAH